jgi:hypothetical protein
MEKNNGEKSKPKFINENEKDVHQKPTCEPTFQRNVLPPFSGSKISRARN